MGIISTVLSTLGGPVADAFGAWQARKEKAKEAESEITKKRIEYKKAKYEAKIKRLTARSDREMSYDMQVLKNRQTSWLDEFLGVAIVGITLCAFLPWTAPYVKEGWIAVSEAPFWFQFAWVTLIASTLGGLTILRIMMGSKVGNGIKNKLESSVTPSTSSISTEGTTHEDRKEAQKETSNHLYPDSPYNHR